MTMSAAQLQNVSFEEAIVAWPHKESTKTLTETQVRQKVRTILAAGLAISPDQLRDDMRIRRDLNVNWYEVAGPVMRIENLFRTLLQEEAQDDDLSVDMIVEKLMRRGHPRSIH